MYPLKERKNHYYNTTAILRYTQREIINIDTLAFLDRFNKNFSIKFKVVLLFYVIDSLRS